MKQWIVFVHLCFFSLLSGDCYYAVPEGYSPIEPCNQTEALEFWEMLQKRGALVGEKVTLSKNEDGTITIHYQKFCSDFILSNTGIMKEDYPSNGKETFVLYKGNLHQDGHLCYLLECTNSGSGNFDTVLGVWKVIDDRIEKMSIYDDLASSFFPGSDAHLFYGHHANPFLIEKDGKVFMRWVDGFFPTTILSEHDKIGPFGMYVYSWEGNAFRYIPTLSKGNDPIVAPLP